MPEIWIDDLLNDFSWDHALHLKEEIVARLGECEFRRHPLGFIHAALIDRDDIAIRFHMWKPGMRAVQEPAWLIHTHTFELNSIVLFGELENSIYKWEPNTSSPDTRLYVATYQNGLSQIIATDQVGVPQLEFSSEIAKGSGYRVTYGDFHQTNVASDQLTATIAVATKFHGSPLIVGSLEGQASYSYAREVLNSEIRQDLIRDVLDFFQ
jgi:hypothetical protein